MSHQGQQGQQRGQTHQQPGRQGATGEQGTTDQRGGVGHQEGRQSQSVDEGLQYGGAARHDHSDTHVGARQTFGAPGREERRRQRAAESSAPQEWLEETRQYPGESAGHEQYGQGHAHDTEEHSPLGRGLEESRE